MIDEQPEGHRGTLPLAMTPLLGLLELQQDMVRMHLEAATEVSRRSLHLIESQPPASLPEAPMQVMSFFSDCMKLSLSPLMLMASGGLARFPLSPGPD